jgi:perosamine synthetase
MQAPHTRYRLYTSRKSYLPFLRDLLVMPESGEAKNLFEERLKAFLNVSAVTTVPMCRTGIYLAVKQVIRPGQDVVMSPYTIADVVNMVILAGGRPAFADIERSSCNISVNSIEQLLHAGTGAVLVTHLHGIGAPIREICSLCESRGVPVIEDVAQAFGAKVQGRRLGTYGDVGVFSFGMYKNINSWYGGAITCKRSEVLANVTRELDSFAFQSRSRLIKRMLQGFVTDAATHPFTFRLLTYWIFRFGRLYDVRWINRFVETELDLSRRDTVPIEYMRKMTEAQHRLGLVQLDDIDRCNQIRLEKASRYRKGLEGVEGFILPPVDAGGAIYTYFPIQYGNGLSDRQRLLRFMAMRGCDVGPQHLKNCADLPSFSDFYRDCPNARRTAEAVVLLPTYPSYPESDIDHNIAVLRAYAAKTLSAD